MLDISNPGSPTPAENLSAPQLRQDLRSWTRDLAVALGLALVIIVFLYQPVKVEGTSMAPLLSDQERIFINKFVYRFEPIGRGDVIVFWYPLDRSKSFIKRVIGLPGETIELRGGRLYVDGKARPEVYIVFGPIGRRDIYGKAVFAYWPVDHFGSLTGTSTVNAASK